ncbi:MAG: hypothetical protein MUF78_02585 [Candidatus Edwardsbacteria bacterium]|jgi:hypothetical protein|nr:hypothetical protein [Candidatus Edwardsbacteria bacterium]
MNKIKALKVVNLVLFLLFLLQAATGLLMAAGAGGAFLVHVASGLCLVLAGAAHLALNWGWVKMQYLKPR